MNVCECVHNTVIQKSVRPHFAAKTKALQPQSSEAQASMTAQRAAENGMLQKSAGVQAYRKMCAEKDTYRKWLKFSDIQEDLPKEVACNLSLPIPAVSIK